MVEIHLNHRVRRKEDFQAHSCRNSFGRSYSGKTSFITSSFKCQSASNIISKFLVRLRNNLYRHFICYKVDQFFNNLLYERHKAFWVIFLGFNKMFSQVGRIGSFFKTLGICKTCSSRLGQILTTNLNLQHQTSTSYAS